MKIINLSAIQILAIFLVGFLSLTTTSCVEELDSVSEDFTLELPDFSSVTLDFPANVIITQGAQQPVRINAQPEVFEALNKTVIDNEWLIDLNNLQGRFESVTIEITIPTIEGLFATSTGDIIVSNDFDNLDLLTLETQSTGSIEFSGTAQQIDLLIDSTGDIDLNGATITLNARLNGTGDLNAFGLVTEDVDLVSTSTGDAEIWVENTLTVRMSGTGDVRYRGQPIIDSQITGTGELIDAN